MITDLDIKQLVKDIQDTLNADLEELDHIPKDVKDAFIEDMCIVLNSFASTLEKYSVIFERYDK